MSNRRRLARERLEVYLVYLILAHRYLILTSGLFLLIYAIVVMVTDLPSGFPALIPAIYLLLLSSSYYVVLYTARAGAWVGTLGRYDD